MKVRSFWRVFYLSLRQINGPSFWVHTVIPHHPAAQFPEWHLGMSSSCSLRVNDMPPWSPQLPSCPHSSKKAGVGAKAGLSGACRLVGFFRMFNCWPAERLLCYFPYFQCLLLKERDILCILQGVDGERDVESIFKTAISSSLRAGSSHTPCQHLSPGETSFPLVYALFLLPCFLTPPHSRRDLWRPVWLLPLCGNGWPRALCDVPIMVGTFAEQGSCVFAGPTPFLPSLFPTESLFSLIFWVYTTGRLWMGPQAWDMDQWESMNSE